MSWGAWESVHGGSRKWFPDHLASGPCRYRPRMPVTAAAGMTVPLLDAAITHRRADAGKAVAAALLALADLAVALTSSA